MEHKIATDCGKPDCNGCLVCQCGVCSACGLYEGALTTDCPEVSVSFETSDKIYKSGKLDFRNGKWVDEPNPTHQIWERHKQ